MTATMTDVGSFDVTVRGLAKRFETGGQVLQVLQGTR